MKNLLVLNNFSIYPPDHGGKIRIFNIYRELSSKYNVRYICFGNSKEIEITQLAQNFLEVKVPKSYIHKVMEKFMGTLLDLSIDDIIAMFFCKFNKNLSQTVKNYLSDSEIVVASLPYMYPVIKKHSTNKLLIYEAQNVEYILKKTILDKSYFKKILYEHVNLIEKELAEKSDLIFAVSEEDKNKFKEIYNISDSKIKISSNGVNLNDFNALYENNKLIREKIINNPIAVFMGSGHPPNVEAAKKLIYEIAPKMHDVYFLICGSVCWGLKNEIKPKNVGLTFDVSDEEKIELYRISDIALNPMLSGSGSNLKMFDYMAAGLPVIATPTGARGLDLENYHDALICDIAEFPQKIREVLKNKDFYNKLSFNGRKLVEEKYDWEKIAIGMAKNIEEKLVSDSLTICN